MRHTLIRRVEDAEELGPQEGAPWVERGWTPLPCALEACTGSSSMTPITALMSP